MAVASAACPLMHITAIPMIVYFPRCLGRLIPVEFINVSQECFLNTGALSLCFCSAERQISISQCYLYGGIVDIVVFV